MYVVRFGGKEDSYRAHAYGHLSQAQERGHSLPYRTVRPLPLKQRRWLRSLYFPPPQLAVALTLSRSQEGQRENSTLCSQAGLTPSAWDEHTASVGGLCQASSSLCPRHLAPQPSDPTGLPQGSWSQAGSFHQVTCRIYGWNLVETN